MADTLERFAGATAAIVADVLDRLGFRDRALDPEIAPLWPGARIVGYAYPVAVRAEPATPASPYEGEMSVLESLEAGDVPLLVVEHGVRAASWGELFSCAALGRGSRGVVIDGLIRDAEQIEELGFAAFARGRSPLDTFERAVVASHGDPVLCGGVEVVRGDLVVADRDGIVVVPAGAANAVAEAVESKHELEQGARNDLLAGVPIREVWQKYGVF